ncbi:hypothetical protein GH733_011891 [Mirounga leonina]|nr:hypothetical protein GH733_011891 [Mirounga leonina]
MLQELREVVHNILQYPNRIMEGVTSDSLVAETDIITSIEELDNKMEFEKTKTEQDNHPGIKLRSPSYPIPWLRDLLQLFCRVSGTSEVQAMKLISLVQR